MRRLGIFFNLKGEGQLTLNNAKIEKLNILKTILDRLNFVPGLGGILQNAVETSMPANIKAEENPSKKLINGFLNKIL